MISIVLVVSSFLAILGIFYYLVKLGQKMERDRLENINAKKANEDLKAVIQERETIHETYEELRNHYPDNWDNVKRLPKEDSSEDPGDPQAVMQSNR